MIEEELRTLITTILRFEGRRLSFMEIAQRIPDSYEDQEIIRQLDWLCCNCFTGVHQRFHPKTVNQRVVSWYPVYYWCGE